MRSDDAPVVVLGAGATKASGGPMTNEVLPALFGKTTKAPTRPDLKQLDRFFVEVFAVPKNRKTRQSEDFPPLPLLLSLVDTAIDRKEPIAHGWPVPELVKLRRAIEYSIYAVLNEALTRITDNPHRTLFQRVRQAWGRLPHVISLNYDLVADNTLTLLGGQYADFACDIATPAYQKARGANLLLKLHGSLAWLYCSSCHRMELALSPQDQMMVKKFPGGGPLVKRFDSEGCPSCGAPMESIMITPTYRKDYRNPHVSRVWYEAERVLRAAKRVIFIGYSLPEDDVEVIYLLKRGLHGMKPKQITVVEKASESGHYLNVRKRYQQLFGADIDWHGHENGFAGWLGAVDVKLVPKKPH